MCSPVGDSYTLVTRGKPRENQSAFSAYTFLLAADIYSGSVYLVVALLLEEGQVVGTA